MTTIFFAFGTALGRHSVVIVNLSVAMGYQKAGNWQCFGTARAMYLCLVGKLFNR